MTSTERRWPDPRRRDAVCRADAEPLSHRVLSEGRLSFSASADCIADVATLVVTIGTPIDEFLNPEVRIIKKWADQSLPVSDGRPVAHLAVDRLSRHDAMAGEIPGEGGEKPALLAYCPERIVQGFAVRELQTLPQIISGTTPEAEQGASAVFSSIAPQVVRLTPLEAEFAKLFANAYRYIEFAIANQFYTIAHSAGRRLQPRARRIAGQLSARAGHSAGRVHGAVPASSKTRCNWPPFRRISFRSAMRPCSSTKVWCCTWSTT